MDEKYRAILLSGIAYHNPNNPKTHISCNTYRIPYEIKTHRYLVPLDIVSTVLQITHFKRCCALEMILFLRLTRNKKYQERNHNSRIGVFPIFPLLLMICVSHVFLLYMVLNITKKLSLSSILNFQFYLISVIDRYEL